MCPRCGYRVLFKDADGRWCLACAWREASPPTHAERPEARPATHAHKTLNKYEELKREARR